MKIHKLWVVLRNDGRPMLNLMGRNKTRQDQTEATVLIGKASKVRRLMEAAAERIRLEEIIDAGCEKMHARQALDDLARVRQDFNAAYAALQETE